MSTNYFNPISYLPRQPVRPATQINNPTSQTLTPANPAWTNVFGYTPGTPGNQSAAPNQGNIQRLIGGLYGVGRPGEAGYVPGINERAARDFGLARNNARDALRGYGGITFRQDDTSTPNVDESLMVDYQPDQLGRNERQAVLAARAQANARGMLSSGFADQQIGAALQRVGEEARQIVNQYSQQINQIATQYFDPLTGQVAVTLGQIGSLYGSDVQWAASQEQLRPPPPAPAPPPEAPAPNPAVRAAGTVLWTGRSNPDRNAARFDQMFGAGNWITDVEFVRNPNGRGGFNRYTVRAR